MMVVIVTVTVTVVTVVVRVTSFGKKKKLNNLTPHHQCDVFRAAFRNLAMFY